MARPLRGQWQIRTIVRRRHRTWVAAMVMATFGWGAWWITALLYKFAPGSQPSLLTTYVVASVFALAGFGLALFSIRARLIWILLAGVPLFANGSLLMMPLLLDGARALMDSEAVDRPAED